MVRWIGLFLVFAAPGGKATRLTQPIDSTAPGFCRAAGAARARQRTDRGD
jgi:hypothetical protein